MKRIIELTTVSRPKCRRNPWHAALTAAMVVTFGLTGLTLSAGNAVAVEDGPALSPTDQAPAAAVIEIDVSSKIHEVDSAASSHLREHPRPCCGICFPEDQLWLVSTRRLCGCHSETNDPDVWRYEPDSGWRPSSMGEFLAADDPAMPTSIWTHGNRISHMDSRSIGRRFFDRLRPHAPRGVPLRLVIWSWPADRIRGGVLNDFRVKAARADVDAYHLAAVVNRINPLVPVGMVGYSYGARIITGALHVLGGGDICGCGLDQPVTAIRRPLRAALLGAAVNNDWILPGRPHGLAVSQVENILIAKNPSDRVLKYYPIAAYGRIRTGPQALGYTGVPGIRRLGPDAYKVRQLCVTGWVGRNHDLDSYTRQPSLMARVAQYAFFDGSSTEVAAANQLHATE